MIKNIQLTILLTTPLILSWLLVACQQPTSTESLVLERKERPTATEHDSYIEVSSAGFKTRRQAIAYAIGMDYAQGIARRNKYLSSLGIQLDVSFIQQGFAETLHSSLNNNLGVSENRLTQDELKKLIYQFDREILNIVHTNVITNADKNRKEGSKYLFDNAKKENVVTLNSGLQYKIIKQGGGEKTVLTDKVIIEYHGKLINGEKFEGSFDKKVLSKPFKIKSAIAGWAEALLLMHEGDLWEITIPASLAYGSSQHGIIPADSVLIYEIRLVEIIKS